MPLNVQLQSGDVAKCPTLRFGTHNVRGLCAANILRFTQTWDDLHLGIVFIQEHWSPSTIHSHSFRRLFTHRQQGRGWTVFWRYKTTRTPSAAPTPSSPELEAQNDSISRGMGKGGVAIAIRSSLIRDEIVTIVGDPSSVGPADLDGRVISLNIDWAGHKLSLASLYLPNTALERAAFLRNRLVPLVESATAAKRQLLWGGDFNFVHNPSIDRIKSSGGRATIPTATTEHTGNVWASLPSLAALVDVFRLQHPTSRHMTWRKPNGRSAARLDRVYTSGELSTLVFWPSNLPRSPMSRIVNDSDHELVVCHLAPRSHPSTTAASSGSRRAPPRLNVSFMKDPLLCQRLED